MGLSLEFYAGDAAIIGADFTDINLEGIRNGSRARAYADFSLHLSPSDLDILSELIADRVGTEPLLLNDSLVRNVGAFEDGGSADVVDLAWVRMVASLDEAALPDLAVDWIQAVAEEYGQPLEVSPESLRALRELTHLCQLAIRERIDVVHAWYL